MTTRARWDAIERILLPAALVVAVIVLNWPLRDDPVTGLDEGSLLAYGSRVFGGAVPYRDFVTFYGPANPYVIGAAMHVFGATVEAERLLGFTYKALLVLAFYGLPLPLPRWGRATVAFFVAMATYPLGVSALATIPALAAVVAAIGLLTRENLPSRRRFALAGACLGIAALYRFDFFVVAALAAAALAWRRPRDRILALTAGALVVVGLYVPVLIAAGPEAFISNLADLARSGPGRRLPLPPAAGGLRVQLIALVVGPAVLVGGAFWLRRRNERARDARLVLALGLGLAGLVPYGLSRADYVHLGLQYTTFAAALLAATLWLARNVMRRSSRTVSALMLVAVATLTIGLVRPTNHQINAMLLGSADARAATIRFGERSLPVRPEQAESLKPVLARLQRLGIDSPRLFVGSTDLRTSSYNDTSLYFLLEDATPASRYWELNPGTANRRGSSLRHDLASADVLLLTSAYDDFDSRPLKELAIENGLNAHVRRRFCALARSGTYVLLRRCVR